MLRNKPKVQRYQFKIPINLPNQPSTVSQMPCSKILNLPSSPGHLGLWCECCPPESNQRGQAAFFKSVSGDVSSNELPLKVDQKRFCLVFLIINGQDLYSCFDPRPGRKKTLYYLDFYLKMMGSFGGSEEERWLGDFKDRRLASNSMLFSSPHFWILEPSSWSVSEFLA